MTTTVKNLTYAGYDDWRLPTPKELLGIEDHSRSYPMTYTDFFVVPDSTTQVGAGSFWTSKEPINEEYAFVVYFSSGEYSTEQKSTESHVRCIRGNELPESVFINSSVGEDEIVTDTTTGLVWQKSYISKTWQEALTYCENIEYAGFSDWRLPNRNELANHPELSGSFWTSTSSHVRPGYKTTGAWALYGSDTSGGVVKTSSSFTKCVR